MAFQVLVKLPTTLRGVRKPHTSFLATGPHKSSGRTRSRRGTRGGAPINPQTRNEGGSRQSGRVLSLSLARARVITYVYTRANIRGARVHYSSAVAPSVIRIQV